MPPCSRQDARLGPPTPKPPTPPPPEATPAHVQAHVRWMRTRTYAHPRTPRVETCVEPPCSAAWRAPCAYVLCLRLNERCLLACLSPGRCPEGISWLWHSMHLDEVMDAICFRLHVDPPLIGTPSAALWAGPALQGLRASLVTSAARLPACVRPPPPPTPRLEQATCSLPSSLDWTFTSSQLQGGVLGSAHTGARGSAGVLCSISNCRTHTVAWWARAAYMRHRPAQP